MILSVTRVHRHRVVWASMISVVCNTFSFIRSSFNGVQHGAHHLTFFIAQGKKPEGV